MLTAAMFLAGCQKEAEPEPTPEPDKIVLSDGTWHMDSTTSVTMTMNGQEKKEVVKQHVEMEISGDDVEIIKATVTENGTETDYTNELREAIKTRADAENLDNFETEQAGTGSIPPVQMPNITVETNFEENEDGTEYRITTHISYVYADFVDPAMASNMEALGLDIHAPIINDSEIIYRKISD